MRIVHGGSKVGVAVARSARGQGPLHGLPGRRQNRRPGLCLPREGGDGRAGRQGRDARPERRLTSQRAVAGALWAGCAGAGEAGARSSASTSPARSICSSSPPLVRRSSRADSRRPVRRADPDRPACLDAPAGSRRRLVGEARRAGAGAALRRARVTRGARTAPTTPPTVLTGVSLRDADRTRARRWPGRGRLPVRLRGSRRSRWPTTASTASAPRCGRADRYRGTRIARELHAGNGCG